MSNKMYNMFGEIEDIDSIEKFSTSETKSVNKYTEWTPRNDREKLAIQRLRFYQKSEDQVLSAEDKKLLPALQITIKEAQLGKQGNFTLDYVSKLREHKIDIANAYFGVKAGFNLDEILKIKGEIADAVVARINGISKKAIVDYVNKNVKISDVVNKKFSRNDVRKSDGLKLKGNLEMEGNIRATAFYLADGTKLTEVPKLALPSNVYHKDSKIGINVQNPESSLDIKGNLDVDEEITSNDVISKKIKTNELISKTGWLENVNSSNLNITNPKNSNNPTGWGSHLNWQNKAENYLRGKTELRGETNFVGPARINITNPKNGNNPTGWGTHFNWQNKAENYIRGKTELRGETNFVGPARLNIHNNKNANNPTGWGTHFNYMNRGENYIRGKTELRGEVNFVDRNKEIIIHQNKNKNNPTGGATHFNHKGRSENYIRGKTELRGEVNLTDTTKGLNISNIRNGNNPEGHSTHFNNRGTGKNYIRGTTEIKGPEVNIISNSGIRVHGHGKMSTFGSLNSGWCHITTTADKFHMNKSLHINGALIANSICLKDGKKTVCLDAQKIKGLMKNQQSVGRAVVNSNYYNAGGSLLHYSKRLNDRVIHNILDNSTVYEIKFNLTVKQNVGAWRNIIHYGNTDGERAPALWIWPHNPWRIHFRVGIGRNNNHGTNFYIPGDLRRYNTPCSIIIRVTEDVNNNRVFLQAYVNNRYIVGNYIHGRLIRHRGRNFYIKDPWFGHKNTYDVENVVLRRIR